MRKALAETVNNPVRQQSAYKRSNQYGRIHRCRKARGNPKLKRNIFVTETNHCRLVSIDKNAAQRDKDNQRADI